ncbi:synergin gamma isoform X3 [Engraulis encrasicolus]|uniref:synergin gamma isoform X3 n=1 Tax=Engraulis encrasicolus TaxID=184585 RepID=UPI002FCFE5C5
MALRPGSGGGGSFMYRVGGGMGPPQGMMPMQQQQPQQQQAYPMVPNMMQPNMQGMMGMNFAGQMAPGAMPMQGGMPMGMQAPGMQFMGQPQFMGMRGPAPQYPADLQKQMAEEHQKRLEQQQRMLEEDRKRRQFEEQKQKLRLLSSVKPKQMGGEKSRDDALEAIKGNLDGFSRDAKMHPTPSNQAKKPDSSPLHSSSSSTSSSAPSLSLSPAPLEDDDDFSDFMQGPAEALSSSSSSSSSMFPPSCPTPPLQGSNPAPHHPVHQSQPTPTPTPTAIHQHTTSSSAISSSPSAFQGPSLEEKLFSSCDMTAQSKAQVHFRQRQPLSQLGSRAGRPAQQYQPSTKARNWAHASEDLSSAFVMETPSPEVLAPVAPATAASAPGGGVVPSAEDQLPSGQGDGPAQAPSAGGAGVGVYPQQEHLQPMVPTWLYNDSLIPEMFKKVLEFTMTPAGIDTGKLYPILMSSGLPREALGQIWALANRTTPGKLTKEELYTVLALIGVAQSGLPVMSPDILNQFPSPPVPNLPALAMTMPGVMPQHQHQAPGIMAQPPVSMPMPMPTPTPPVSMAMPAAAVAPAISMAMPTAMPAAPLPVMAMTPNPAAGAAAAVPPPAQAAPPSFIANFPPVQATKAGDDDDFQDFQEAPKAGGAGDDSFSEFQGDSGSSFPTSVAGPQNSAPALLTPVSGSSSTSSSDKYAAFKQLSVEQPAEPAPPAPGLGGGDKYSVFRELEPTADRKPIGEGFADFKSGSVDDGFTDFKTADSAVSPLESAEPAKVFQPTFPPPTFPPSLSQPALHSSSSSSAPLSSSQQPPRNPLNMADLDLFSAPAPPSSSSSLPPSAVTSVTTMGLPAVDAQAAAPSLLLPPGAGAGAVTSDDFGDFALFGSSSAATEPVTGSGSGVSSSAVPPPQQHHHHHHQQQQQQQQDDFADFLAFGSSSESRSSGIAGGVPQRQPSLGGSAGSGQDRYDVFKQLSMEGGLGSGSATGSAYGDADSTGSNNGKDSGNNGMIGGISGGFSGSGGLSGSFSSPRGSDANADDFADFQASRLGMGMGSTALGSGGSASDRCSPAERAFRQAGIGKEDSGSVKSLDLPSLGGSSGGGGREEDALSLQLDLKLVEAGGDLRHGASDSSLDLPGLSGHQPHAADSDELKFDPFGMTGGGGGGGGSSSRASYDWSDRDDLSSNRGGGLGPQTGGVAHRQDTGSFGSSESMTQTSGVPKLTTTSAFASEDSGSSGGDRYEAFARFSGTGGGGMPMGEDDVAADINDDDDDFGDFASTVSEKSDSPPVVAVETVSGSEVAVEATAGSEAWDEFGAFQGDKPKFGKLDFLKASSQTKVKSSEEMIKNELATFDLSVQGSHKRSHSLGEKELGPGGVSAPTLAPEAPFRDRSSTLSDKPAALPVIRDKYKDLTGEVEESERYAYEWQRCLESALQVITTANNTLNGISSSTVCTEVIQSAQGMEYLLGVVEVYRVTKRVELGIKATAVCSEKLQQQLKDINRVWNNLMGFMSLANLTPDESSLDFSSCILRPGIKNAKELACGVCLLNVDSRSKKKEDNGKFGRLFKRAMTKDNDKRIRAFNSETDNFKLTYGGHQYHASCANFWINCVEPKPPGLILPDLL